MNNVYALRVSSRKRVSSAYNFLDALYTVCGIYDLTEGIYKNSETGYFEAQRAQRQWLLDKIGCVAGTRLLDIGCGYGVLLDEAENRGAEAVGITLSKKQARYCQSQGLTAYVCDYREIGDEWKNSFDCIVANGSAEHFVQPTDALNGQQDAIYREFFSICHRLIDSESPLRRLATTIIHFDRFCPHPSDILKNPLNFPRGSDGFHAALLSRVLGGFYPVEGQLEKCANSFFTLSEEVDGTEDYRLTSEEWLDMARQSLRRPSKLGLLLIKVFPNLFVAPRQLLWAVMIFFSQSWQWQFRGQYPPMKLYRHIWQYL